MDGHTLTTRMLGDAASAPTLQRAASVLPPVAAARAGRWGMRKAEPRACRRRRSPAAPRRDGGRHGRPGQGPRRGGRRRRRRARPRAPAFCRRAAGAAGHRRAGGMAGARPPVSGDRGAPGDGAAAQPLRRAVGRAVRASDQVGRFSRAERGRLVGVVRRRLGPPGVSGRAGGSSAAPSSGGRPSAGRPPAASSVPSSGGGPRLPFGWLGPPRPSSGRPVRWAEALRWAAVPPFGVRFARGGSGSGSTDGGSRGSSGAAGIFGGGPGGSTGGFLGGRGAARSAALREATGPGVRQVRGASALGAQAVGTRQGGRRGARAVLASPSYRKD